MKRAKSHHQQGLTLLELTVVLLILIALGGLMLPYVGGTGQYAHCTATEASMRAIRDAIVGSYGQPGYFEDMSGLPGSLDDLISHYYCKENNSLLDEAACSGAGNSWVPGPPFNPVTGRGWQGPYLNTGINDAFNFVAIELRPPAATATKENIRLVSAGPNSVIDSANDDDATGRADDRILFLFRADPDNDYKTCRELYL